MQIMLMPCVQDGAPVANVEGADAAGLTAAVRQHFGEPAAQSNGAAAFPGTNGAVQTSVAAAKAGGKGDLESRLKSLVSRKPVMLFMKVWGLA
jgi:hypothetical protein